MRPLPPGLTHTRSLLVDARLTVPYVSDVFTDFRDMPPVFATAYLVGFVEWTCVAALRLYLEDDEQTVGTHIDISHCAATPPGMLVTAQIGLIAAERRRLRFSVTCRDQNEVIGEGVHERAVIARTAFDNRMAKKIAAQDTWDLSGHDVPRRG